MKTDEKVLEPVDFEEYDEDLLEDEENGAPISPEDYKLMMDLLDELREQYDTLRKFYEDYVTNTYSLDPKIINGILPITKAEIEEMNLDQMCEFIDQYSETSNTKDAILEIQQQLIDDDMLPEVGEQTPEEKLTAELRKILLDIKKSSMTVYAQKREVDRAIADSNDIMEDYLNYLSSDKIVEARTKYLENLKESLKKTDDGPMKNKMEKMVADIEASYNLSFIFNRLESLGVEEMQSVVDAFFSNQKGKYVMNRFNTKIKAFGFNKNIFQRFLNLEEMFLPEEYHPFNNLFLFTYIRIVAYADPYNKTDKMWVQAITAKISDLIYHRFQTDKKEKIFIAIIKRVDDYYQDYREKFVKDNETWPGHESRKKNDAKRTSSRVEILKNKLDEFGITTYDNDWDADTLQRFFEDQLNQLIDSQKDDFPSEIDDDEVSPSPTTTSETEGVVSNEDTEKDVRSYTETETVSLQ